MISRKASLKAKPSFVYRSFHFWYSKHHRVFLFNFIEPSSRNIYFFAIDQLHGIIILIDKRFSDKSNIDQFRAIDFHKSIITQNLLKKLYIVARHDSGTVFKEKQCVVNRRFEVTDAFAVEVI